VNGIGDAAIAVRAVVNCVGLLVFAWGMRRRDVRLGAQKPAPPWLATAVRALAFAVLCGAAVAVRCVAHLRFLGDFVAMVALFATWILATRRAAARTAVYVAVVVFLCLDLTVALANSAYHRLPAFTGWWWPALIELAYALVMLGLCCLLRRWAPTGEEPAVGARSFGALLLALAPYLIVRSSDLFYDMEGSAGVTMEMLLAATIVATFGAFVGNHTAVLAANEKVRRLQLEMELAEHRRRYQVRKETVDEVNRRYHDMVRYARTFDQAAAQGTLGEYLEERMVRDLPAAPLWDTGNDTLDMLLWEASERCRAADVRFVPIVDVADTGGVSGFDLHTMVGNALDNAIEAAAGVSERELREVRLSLRRVNRLLFMTVENRFAGELAREGERLLSTKPADDGRPHGYGLENIRRAAVGCGGSMDYAVDGDRFVLTAMVPLDERVGAK
jgi:hypothetical protein